ncbi:LytTR family transcriptional regulator DNA-binding domain-containing protein [Aquimarina sp. SS2-1]|uniref:LytTR family transcriptional regulator DNA-binding domain-containing protein n=1 Tax=Aquimarina besae TaxID=3342247 RepID=UPI00366B2B61
MRKDRLYFFTFLAITGIFVLIASIAVQYFIEVSANQLLETQLESSKREAKEIANLVNYQLEGGIDKNVVIQNIQNSIENTNVETGFISVFDWSGKEICHPDKKRIGQQVSPNQSFISSVNDELTSEDFYDLLQSKKEIGGVRDFENSDQASEILYLHPVKNSDWIVAAHANMSKISSQVEQLRKRFFILFTIMGFIIILSFILCVRLIGGLYEKKLELQNQKLEEEVVNLSKLNRAVNMYQQKVNEERPQKEETVADDKNDKEPKDDKDDKSKKRILTYKRDELLPINIDDIAYIYTENTITYVVCIDGKRSTSNSSLDELFSTLDSTYFYRANRQFIIAVSAIEKIIKYGNNQLKILVNPNSEVDIIISKNRAAEFKQWLNL